MKISRIDYRQQNDYYDADRCHNGGGYDQPYITIEFDDGVTIIIDDTSCGDFGSRIAARVYMGNELMYSAAWGSMCNEWERGSDIPWSGRLQMIYDETGYPILYLEEWEDIRQEEEEG